MKGSGEMRKTLFVLAAVLLASGAAFGFSFELGGGFESVALSSSLIPTVSAGAIVPIGDNFGATGQINYIYPYLFMGLVGGRFTFGAPENALRMFLGADGGVLNLVYYSYPIAGVNGGLNLSMGSFGLYLKAALRMFLYSYDGVILQSSSVPMPMFEVVGGVTFSF